MKVRFFQVVWSISAIVVAIMLAAAMNSNTAEELAIAMIMLGIPAAIGFVATYIAIGSFRFPQEK